MKKLPKQNPVKNLTRTMHQHQGASIRYRLEIIDPDGGIAQTRPWKKNLILDRGLDEVASCRWDELLTYAVAGTNPEPTRRDSGQITFTQAGKIITASAGFFVQQDAGRLLKLNTGEELRIEAYTDSTKVKVTADRDSAAPTQGTVWYVNQTGLVAEVMRTSTSGTGSDDNSVILIDGKVVVKRTRVFAAVASQVTIREIGWSRHSYGGGNLFGRDVLDGAGITLVPGQQLKVVIELAIAVSPLAPTPLGIPPWGRVGGGTVQLENLNWDHRFHPCNTYNYYLSVFVSDSTNIHKTARLNAESGPLTGKTKTVEPVRANYVSGSCRYNYRAVFTLNDGNIDNIRCAGFGWWDYQTFYPIYRVIFDVPQTKDSDNALTLDFSTSWGRTLIN